jgi:cobalt-zinc-cadmium efflux system outer membrane protein
MTSPGGAQPALTLDQAVQRALERNLAIEAARHRVDAARAEQLAASLYPNPTLTLSAENLKVSGPTPIGDLYEVGGTLSQPLELGDKRARRRAVADVTVAVAEAQLAEVLQQRVAEVKRAFHETVLAREAFAHGRALLQNLDEVVALNQARLEAGDIAEGELIKVRLERLKAEAAVDQAELAMRQAGIKLLELLGETDFAHAGQVDGRLARPADGAVPELSALRLDAQRDRPSLLVAERTTTLAERRLAFEQSRAAPDPSPFIGVRRVGENNTVLFGVAVPLPLFDRNQGPIARVTAEAKGARAELELHRTRVLAEVETAYRAWRTAGTQVGRLETALLPRAEESRSIALAAYREGATGLLEYLEAERTLADIRQQYARALFEAQAARLALELALGREIGR